MNFENIERLTKSEFGGENYDCSKLRRSSRLNGWNLFNNINFKLSYEVGVNRNRKIYVKKVVKLCVNFPITQIEFLNKKLLLFYWRVISKMAQKGQRNFGHFYGNIRLFFYSDLFLNYPNYTNAL